MPDVTPPFRLRTCRRASIGSSTSRRAARWRLSRRGGGRRSTRSCGWIARDGKSRSSAKFGGTYAQPRLSPDGRRIAVVVRGDDQHDIWLYEPGRNIWNRFTTEGNSEFPLWTADGTRLAYNSDRSNTVTIDWKRSDGSGATETIVGGKFARRAFPFSWSPDGLLAFVAVRPAQDIFTVRPGSGVEPAVFLATPFVEGAPMFSPDGHAIAYVSSETESKRDPSAAISRSGRKTGRFDCGRQRAAVVADRTRTVLSRRRRGDGGRCDDQPQLEGGHTASAVRKRYEPSISLYANYSTNDGQRFVMIKRLDPEDPAARINLIVNWFDQLRQRQ